MSNIDRLLQDSFRNGLMADVVSAIEATKKYSNNLAIFLDAEVDSVPLPAPIALLRGEAVVRWVVYPATFVELLLSLENAPDRKRWNVTRVAEQVTGYTANGMEIIVTEEDVRAMPVETGKALVQGIKNLGSVPIERPPALLSKDTDGINAPIRMQLGCPIDGVETISFSVTTMGELELVSSGGDLYSRAHGLMELECDDNGYILQTLAPADGWFLLNAVLPRIAKVSRKALKNIRSYEYTMGITFAPDTTLAVMSDRMNDYAINHTRKIKAQKPVKGKRR